MPKIRSNLHIISYALRITLFLSATHTAYADTTKANTLWITPGALSYHFKNRDSFNQVHPGLGIEYQLDPNWAVVGGTYKNSNDRWAQYVGTNWIPWQFGPLRMGATAQIANHYNQARNGKPFAFAAPMLTVEHRRMGANIYIIPTIRNVTGAVALQFKFKWQ